jgi:hypothetical protein
LHFTSFEVPLIKGKWYDSKSPFRTRPNLVLDECGFQRVRTIPLPSHLPVHEPFVRAEDCDRIFFIEDRLNKDWSIIVKYEPRSVPVVYKGAPAPCGSTGDHVVIPEHPNPQPSTSTDWASHDSTFPRKDINYEEEEVVADFQSDTDTSSSRTRSHDSDYYENENIAFEVDLEDLGRQKESQFSPPLQRTIPHHLGQMLGEEQEILDSDPEGNEGHDDQVGEPSSP